MLLLSRARVHPTTNVVCRYSQIKPLQSREDLVSHETDLIYEERHRFYWDPGLNTAGSSFFFNPPGVFDARKREEFYFIAIFSMHAHPIWLEPRNVIELITSSSFYTLTASSLHRLGVITPPAGQVSTGCLWAHVSFAQVYIIQPPDPHTIQTRQVHGHVEFGIILDELSLEEDLTQSLIYQQRVTHI